MPYGVGVRVPLSAQRSLFRGSFFVARSVQKEENRLYITVLQRFARKPPAETENIFLQTVGNTFGSKAQKQGYLPALLPTLHIIHCIAAFYTTINLSCRRFVNPQKFQRHETRDICYPFPDAERTTEEKRAGAHFRTHYDRRAPPRGLYPMRQQSRNMEPTQRTRYGNEQVGHSG